MQACARIKARNDPLLWLHQLLVRVTQLLINAVTGQVKSGQIRFCGNATHSV
jgi:hypothetical protein